MTSHQNSEMPSEPSSPQVEEFAENCATHGPYVARLMGAGVMPGFAGIKSRCPKCAEERRAAEAETERQRAAADRKRRVESILRSAGIPDRFQDRTFATYRATLPGQRIALVTCRKFAESWPAQIERGGSLVFTGGPGTGKTHLACAIASTVAESSLASVSFGTVTQLLRHIRDTYRKDSQRSEQEAIDDLVGPDLLIIDEIGVQTGSDHEKMLLFEVLNERYQQLRPTILISNLSAQDLEGYIGHRIMDRFRECGSVLAFDWPSQRGKAA